MVSADNIDYVDIHALYNEVDFLLFDTFYHGGTGICSSGEIVKKIIDKAAGTKFFFAGGLNPNNVAEKIKLLNPFAVNVQSGVEIDGQKHQTYHAHKICSIEINIIFLPLYFLKFKL